MRQRAGIPMVVVDAAGGACVAACVAAFIWLTLVRPQSPATTIRTLSLSVAELRSELVGFKALRDQEQSLVAARKAELADRGHLPDKPPVEEYFQTFARLAARHGLQVRSQTPLHSRAYPGLLEQRYVCEVVGPVSGIVRFLRAIEDTDFWADVSYLKIENRSPQNNRRGSNASTSNAAFARLTISLFSAPAVSESSAAGGTPGMQT